MKDEYLRDVLIKLLIAIIIFTGLVIGICVYMFTPEKSDNENVIQESSSDIVENDGVTASENEMDVQDTNAISETVIDSSI